MEILDRPRDEGGRPSNETALVVYVRLAETKGVVVRFRGKEVGCLGCLRITVGTEEEVNTLLNTMQLVLADIFDDRDWARGSQMEDAKEHEANDVMA